MFFITHTHAHAQLSSELQANAERSPGLVLNIVEARRRLSGLATSDLLSMPHNDLLEGAIVLEELTKVCPSFVDSLQVHVHQHAAVAMRCTYSPGCHTGF